MNSTRRDFLSALTGAATVSPWRIGWGTAPPRGPHDTPPSTATASSEGPQTPGAESVPPSDAWTEAWQRLPRLPLTRDHLPELGTARSEEWFLASLALCRMRNGTSLDFTYYGGSEPGAFRQVIPMFLFTIPRDLDRPDYAREPVYLLAHCLSRKAARTFRLDRMSL